MANTLKHPPDSNRRISGAVAERTAASWIWLMFATILASGLWLIVMEGPLSPGPTIPDPGSPAANIPLPTEQRYEPNQPPKVVALRVYPKDVDRLARTLELDVSRHGGWTISNKNNRTLTFAVSQQYLDRLQPLAETSDIPRVGAAYAQWIATAVPKPDPELTRAMLYTTVRFHLMSPLTAHPATLPVIAFAGSIIAATFLAVLTCGLVRWCTKVTK